MDDLCWKQAAEPCSENALVIRLKYCTLSVHARGAPGNFAGDVGMNEPILPRAEGDALQRVIELEKRHDLNGAVSVTRRAISEDYPSPLHAPRELRLRAIGVLVKIGALSVARRRIEEYGFSGSSDLSVTPRAGRA